MAKNMKFLLLLSITTLFLVNAPVSAAPPAKDEFPRLGLMLIGGEGHRYHEADYQRQLARFDLVVLNMWPNWQHGGQGATPNEKQAYVLSQIRALNPNIILNNYTIVVESMDRHTGAQGDIWDKVHEEVGPRVGSGKNDWWVRNSSGDNVSDWVGTWIINISDNVQRDENGDTYPEWYAKRNYERLFRNVPQWDGIYHDVARSKPRRNVDWDGDGVKDSLDDWETQRTYRAAHLRQWRLERQLMPDMLLTGNIGSWGRSVVEDFGEWRLDDYHNSLQGGFLEKFMGKSWSIEKNQGWEKMMRAYRVALEHTAYPGIVVLNAGDEDREGLSLYQFFRYGFASTLMDDGYFDFSDHDPYSKIYWFDEYDLAGTATTSWLGEAVDPPQLQPWKNGVYRRRFENGMALVNPRGNGRQTVQIEPGYSFIHGNQDPKVNNGATAQSVTLAERDGVLLISDSASKLARPKPPGLE